MHVSIQLKDLDESVNEVNTFLHDDLSLDDDYNAIELSKESQQRYEESCLPSPLTEEGRLALSGLEKLTGKTIDSLGWDDLSLAAGGDSRNTELLSILLGENLSKEVRTMTLNAVSINDKSIKLSIS